MWIIFDFLCYVICGLYWFWFFSFVNGGNSLGIFSSFSSRFFLGLIGINSSSFFISSLYKVGEKGIVVIRRIKLSAIIFIFGRVAGGGDRGNVFFFILVRISLSRLLTGFLYVSFCIKIFE